MSDTKKVRKKRFNFLKFLVFILFLYIIITGTLYIIDIPIKNIVILNNNYLNDEKIIEIAKIEDYPSFFKTFSFNIKKRLKKLELIEDVKIKKKWGYKLVIEVKEKKILYISRNDNLYTFNSGDVLELGYIITGVPVLINFVPDDIKNEFNEKFSKLTMNTISKISEIEYSPTGYDSKRFVLYMNDSNMIYITISKLEKLNKYEKIVSKLEGHTGILYLDSGNYFEIKE